MSAIDKRFKHFIGVDVGKTILVIQDSTRGGAVEISNTRASIKRFFKQKEAIVNACLVVCETTGGYEAALLEVCHALGFAIHRANSFHVKSFVRSLGIQSKTDAIDAGALAVYGQERYARLALWSAPTASEKQLKKLMQRRADLIHMSTQEKNRLQAPDEDALVQKTIEVLLRALDKQLQIVDASMTKLIKDDAALAQRYQLMTQISGVGEKTANVLIAAIPELGQLTRRQVASLAGLAPYAKDSGLKHGRRTIRGGRKQVRNALFMAALSAARYHATLKTFYLRLIQNGKRPLVALTAVMRKLLTIINAKIRDASAFNSPVLQQS